MDLSAILPRRREVAVAAGAVAAAVTGQPGVPAAEQAVLVRPVRAAGVVALAAVDADGKVWVRFSTALAMMVCGLMLLLVPVLALVWAGSGLVSSGQVTLGQQPAAVQAHRAHGAVAVPTQLPLAQGAKVGH